MENRPLQGRGIVVTRPREQAAGLSSLIEQAGGRALLFPAVAIEDVAEPAALRRLAEFDLAIFISPIAVDKALNRVRPWPPSLGVAAVGAGTRRELERHGIGSVLAPQSGADSEALLALPELERVAGKRIVIFRGEGGRALLGDTLAARGARVEYAECYRRTRPRTDAGPLLAAWRSGAVHAVTVSSAQGLANLFEMLDGELLRAAPLFVPHPRIAARAAERGVREVIVAGPGDDQMIERLVAYFT